MVRTRVRPPPSPLDAVETNPHPISKIAVCRNVFCLVLPIQREDVPKRTLDRLTFSIIQDWIYARYEKKVSRSSISMVIAKCGLESLNSDTKGCIPDNVTTEREKLVLEAFKHFNLV